MQRRAQNANRLPARRKGLQTNKGELKEKKPERELDAGDQEAEDDEEGIEKKKKTSLERCHFLHQRTILQVRRTYAEEETTH